MKKKFGPRNYGCIITHNGREIKRHLDQIRETIESENSAEASSDDAVSNELENSEQFDVSENQESLQSNQTVEISDESSNDVTDTSSVIEDDQFSTPVSSRPTRDCATNAMRNMQEQRRLHLI